jgi:hypothetical protein
VISLDLKEFFFEPFLDCEKKWKSIILPKIRAGHRVNIYFSSNTIPTHYFCLFQFWYLSRIAKLGNVYLYIVLNDQITHKPAVLGHFHNFNSDRQTLSDVKKIFEGFGVPSERVFAYYSSEISGKMFNIKKGMSFMLFKGIRSIGPEDLKIPKEICELEYMEKETQYPLSYALPKFVDLFTMDFFKEICPEDINGKIDIFVTSGFGRPAISKLRNILIKDGLFSENSPVFGSIPRIPFFGHTTKIFKKHVAPNIEMSSEDIYEVILTYRVKTEHMKELLHSVLKWELGQLSVPGEKNTEIKTTEITDFEKFDYKKQALILAVNLFDFLQKVKTGMKKERTSVPVVFDSKEIIKEFSKIFRSELGISVLKECNGQKITEIAKKLNKHQPNISKIAGKLKKLDLISVDKEGGLHRNAETIKIDLKKL